MNDADDVVIRTGYLYSGSKINSAVKIIACTTGLEID